MFSELSSSCDCPDGTTPLLTVTHRLARSAGKKRAVRKNVKRTFRDLLDSKDDVVERLGGLGVNKVSNRFLSRDSCISFLDLG